jgi:hypothetical protein
MIWRRSALRPLDAAEFNRAVQRHGFLHPLPVDAWTVLPYSFAELLPQF